MDTTASPSPTDSLFARGRAGPSLGAVALVTLLAFETVAVSAAMPAIAEALDGLALYALAFGGMLATSVLGMVLAGHAIDRQGALKPTAIGLAVFGVGLLLSGLADRMGWLVAGRIVQGLGAGMLGVALYAGMGQLVPAPLHPRLFSLFATAWVLPGLLGPSIAAALVLQFGWRAVFLVVAAAVPVTAALLLPAFARLPAPPRAASTGATTGVRWRHLAPVGWAALGALGALLLHGAGGRVAPSATLALLLAGLLAALWAARHLLPRGSLVAAPGLPAVIALRGLLAAAFGSAEVFIPLYLNRAAGWSLAAAGLALSVGAVLWSSGSAVQARLVAPATRRRGLQAGFAALSLGLGVIALQMATGAPAGWVVAGWALAGFGIGLGFPMLSVLTLAMSADADRGRHASALQLSDALCSSAALAVAGALFNLAGDATGRASYLGVLLLPIAFALGGTWLARRAFAPAAATTTAAPAADAAPAIAASPAVASRP